MRKVLMAVFGACTLAFAVAGATASEAAEPTGGAQPNIIGGHNATETYSFMVALSNSCGGSLVAPQWIVTAHHCGNASQGRIGSISKNSGGEVGQIDRRITKPGTDLALMYLSASARSAPVRMAQTTPAAGSPVRLIG